VEIFTDDGLAMLSRWGHFLAGITWIGLLYYFNFVQGAAFAEMDAAHRTGATTKLVPRALWWFRWGAMFTVITGFLILIFQQTADQIPDYGDYFKSPGGISISTGILFGLTMLANVWLVIWPAQQKVIASAEGVAAGRELDPEAAAAGRRGLLASRTNTLFSIPLLFFMGATSHFVNANYDTREGSDRAIYWIIVLILWAVVELNALGRIQGYGPGPTKKPLETVQNVIISGFVLWAIIYIFWEILFG
jgi:uncharacterized membrane protein